MKKIFLIPMMACLTCISAFAAVSEVSVGTQDELREALAAAPTNGDVLRINLTADIFGTKANAQTYNPSAVTGRFNVLSGTNVILNLSSYGLGAEGFSGFMEPEDGIICYATILNYGTLTIVSEGNGFVSGAVSSDAFYGGVPVITYGDLTINGGIFNCEGFVNKYGVDVTGCLIWGRNNGVSPIKITVNGGLFYANVADYAFGMLHKDATNVTIEVNGGKFGKANKGSDPTELLGDGCSVKIIDGVKWGKNLGGYWVAPAGTAEPANDSFVSGEENAMFIASGTVVTIADGNTLNITKDLAFQDATSKLTIAPGATLIVGDEIIAASTENLELTMDEVSRKYSRLLIKAGQLQETHPKATVKLEAICTENADGTHKWQRFAVPTYLENVKKADFATETGYNTDLFGWDYENDRWSGVSDSENLKPFQCYNMTVDEQVAPVYTFKCELVGNGNPSIALHNEWNYLANSYTAPMNLTAMLQSLINDEQYRSLNAAVWVQKKPGSKDWQSSTFADILDGTLRVKEINPMQAFIYYKLDGTAATIDLDYEAFVYNPLFPKAGAPSRNKVVSEYDYTRASIVVEAENGDEDIVMLYLSDEFSASVMDNGFDIPKYKNTESFNFFAVTELGNLERVGSNSLDGIALVLETKNETSYTVKFENVNLDGYVLLDNETEVSTPIAEESEYTFTAEVNSTIEGRFVITKQQATGIENAAATAKKGIYSMTGVYMGENLENIPAGMYIINGKKVVK